MGTLLLNQAECLTGYGKVSGKNQSSGTLKRIRDLIISYSPVLWILFFLTLTALTNFLSQL